jgi:hypothetical protein
MNNKYTDRHYGDLADSVQSDPNREPQETETAFNFLQIHDRMRVESAYTSIMRRLLLHPKFRLDWYTTSGENADYEHVDGRDYEARDGHDRRKPVYYVAGTLPVGTLKISVDDRSTGGHAKTVADGVFNWDPEEDPEEEEEDD